MLRITINNQQVPKSVLSAFVNKQCGRQHGRNYDHELVLINVNETFFSRSRPEVSRPRPSRAGLGAPRDQNQDTRTATLVKKLLRPLSCNGYDTHDITYKQTFHSSVNTSSQASQR